MPPLKHARQETFCLEYVKDRNGSRAYKAAGYKCGTPGSIAACTSQTLKKANIRLRILELDGNARQSAQKAEDRVALARVIDKVWVVNTLVSNVDRSMQAEPVLDKDGQRTGEYQYQGNVANKGLELIGKHLGMFAEKNPLEGLLTGANVNVSFYLPAKEPRVINGNGHSNGHDD